MIKVRHFELKDWEACNKFMETTRPRGEKGFIANSSGFVVVYEEGEPMDRIEKMSKLRFQIGVHRENILTYSRELRNERKQLTEYMARPKEAASDYDKKKFKEQFETLINGKEKMIELENLQLATAEEMYKETEKGK